jgi:hypothetical protein
MSRDFPETAVVGRGASRSSKAQILCDLSFFVKNIKRRQKELTF